MAVEEESVPQMPREQVRIRKGGQMFPERGLGHMKPGDGMARMVGEREQGKDEQGRGGVGHRIAPFFAGLDAPSAQFINHAGDGRIGAAQNGNAAFRCFFYQVLHLLRDVFAMIAAVTLQGPPLFCAGPVLSVT